MEIVNDIKKMKLDILWNDEDNGLLGKSKPILRLPLKFEEELLIMEGDDDIYLRFSCDEENNFWVPVRDKNNFEHLYKIYTNRLIVNVDEDNEKVIGDNVETDINKLIPLPFENTVYFYGGLCPDIDKLEIKMIFNNYLCRTTKQFETSPWLFKQLKHISSYRTIFSNSLISFQLLTKFSVQLDNKLDSKKYHPLFIKINYPYTHHTGIRHKLMSENMLYNVLDKNMPFDIWASLKSENIFDERKIVDMITGMDDDLDNEKDYLTFVLSALSELNKHLYKYLQIFIFINIYHIC
jgi:hypothetical protein